MDTYEKHPAQALIKFSRGQTNNPLPFFGSDIGCNSYIELTISKARLSRSNHHDHFSEDGMIIRLRMSPNQFSELITTLNCGNGIPATIEMFWPQDLPIGQLPAISQKSKADTFKMELRDIEKEVSQQLDGLEAAIKNLNVSIKTKQDLISRMNGIKMHILSNFPYIVQCAKEQIDKAIVSAKGVIDSFYTGLCTRLGVKALENKLAQLPESTEQDGE